MHTSQTFFSMPFFDSASQDPATLTTVHLWIYWAVAVPLTIVVLLIYALYLLHVERRNRAEDRGPAPSLRVKGSSKPLSKSTSLKETLQTLRLPFTNFCLQARRFRKASFQFWDEERTKVAGEIPRQTDVIPEPSQKPTLPSHPDHTLPSSFTLDESELDTCNLGTLPADHALPRRKTTPFHAVDQDISIHNWPND